MLPTSDCPCCRSSAKPQSIQNTTLFCSPAATSFLLFRDPCSFHFFLHLSPLQMTAYKKKLSGPLKHFFPHILDPNKSQLLHWLISIPKILQHYIARDLGIQSSFSQCTEPESGVEGTATAVTFSCYNKDAISSLLSGCHLWSIFWFFYWCGISLCKKSYFLSTGAILKQFKWLLLAQILKLEIKQWI